MRVMGQAAANLIPGQPLRPTSRYVFPADWGAGHFTAAPVVLNRLCSAARLEGVTLHTLRHTFASLAGELGFRELTIAALLGHSARGVTQRYIHIDEALLVAADRVAAEIAALLDGHRSAALAFQGKAQSPGAPAARPLGGGSMISTTGEELNWWPNQQRYQHIFVMAPQLHAWSATHAPIERRCPLRRKR